MKKLRNFRQHNGLAIWEDRTRWIMLGLGLLFLLAVLLPLAAPIPEQSRNLISAINWTLWGVFAFDYFFRLWLALNRWKFVRTHILDLIIVVVPPFRALRILRLISILLVFLRRAREMPYLVLPLYVAAITTVLIGSSAVFVFDLESTNPDSPISTLGDALWWAFTTVTTVGYGDEYPVTGLGRTLGVFLMLSGITLLGSLTASAAAWLTNTNKGSSEQGAAADEHLLLKEIQELKAEISELKFALRGLEGGNEIPPATT